MATSFRLAGPGKTTRRWLAGGTAAAIVLLGLPTAVVAPASANNNFGPFEIDEVSQSNPGGANLVVDGPDAGSVDWNGLTASQVSTVNDNTVGNKDDSTFTQGSAEYSNSVNNQWPKWVSTGNATNAADKTDIGRVAVYTKSVPDADPTKPARQYAYVGFDRGSDTGTGKYVFEFNQHEGTAPGVSDSSNPKRSVGDVRFIIWEQGNGGLQLAPDANNPDAGFFKWVDPDSDVVGTIDSNNNGKWERATVDTSFFKGAVNKADAVVTAPWWTSINTVTTNGVTTIPTDHFVEAGFDLTGLGAVVGCPSQGFNTFNMRSLTGTGNGNLKDFIKPLTVDVPSTCATMTFTKTSPTGTPLPGTEITITPNPQTGSGSLTVTTGADGTVTVESVKPGIQYTISETKAPLGYILVPWTQTVTLTPGEEFSYTFVNPLGDVSWTKSYAGYTTQDSFPGDFTGATFQVTRADNADPKRDISNAQFAAISGITATGCPTACTFTVQDNGALDEDTAWGKIRVNNLPIGIYTITETAAPTGFAKDTGSATAEVPVELDVAPMADGKVINLLVPATRQGASSGSATFNDPRLPAKLSVKKLGQPGDVLVQGAVFDVYGVVGAKDAVPGVSASGDPADTLIPAAQVTTGANGIGTTPNLPWGFSYYFVEISVPAPWNLPDDRVTNAVALTAADATAQAGGQAPAVLTVNDPKTVIVTDAQDTADLPAASFTDKATVSGIRNDAGGTVTFRLYGPFTSTTNGTCVNEGTGKTLVFTSTKPLGTVSNNSATVTSDAATVSAAGYYYWVAEYSGDPATGTRGATGVCGDPLEITKVNPAKPGISTVAGGDKALPAASLNDVATVTGLNAGATGTVTFKLYGPNDATCSTVVYTTTEDLGPLTQTPNSSSYFAKVTATAHTVNQPGTWRWIASYSGDDNNELVSGKCNDANENWDVDKATTDITTSATREATLPNAAISDSATVTGLTSDATGTVTFTLYGPVTGSNSPAVCSTQVGSPITVSIPTAQISGGSVTVSSGPVTVQQAGAYNWVASYSGDDNNKPSAGKCGDTGETSIVKKAQPTIVTTATDGVIAAGATTATITDTAVVKGLAQNAIGTVTFSVYGPYATQADAEACAVDGKFVKTVSADLPGTNNPGGQQSVGPVSVSVPTSGYYAWKATYSGDANNLTATHDCGEQTGMDEISYVPPRQPAIETLADQTVNLPLDAASVNIGDTATLTGLTGDATGDVIFSLYGPSDSAVCEKVIGTSTVSIDGKVDGTGKAVVASAKLPVSAPGTYWWIASYAGDKDNLAIAGECGDTGESTLVTKAKPGIAKVAKDAEGTVISGTVGDTELVGKVEVGDVITYVVTVSNTGTSSATGPATDTLPVGLGEPTDISDGGVATQLPDGNWKITWASVTVAGGESKDLTYKATVLASAAAEGKDTLINRAAWLGLEDTTTTLVKWITVTATPFCDVNTPKVNYSVATHNLDGQQTAALVWLDENKQPLSDSQAAVLNGQAQTAAWLSNSALSGTLLYPGTVSTGGITTDWPGWKNIGTDTDPVWVVDPDGLKPGVYLQATVNPTAISAEALYPPGADCNPPGVPKLDKSSPTEKGSTANPSGDVLPGATVDYTIELKNVGGQTVTSDLVDTLPAGVTPVAGSYSPSDPTTVVGQVLTWKDVTLEPGATLTVTFKVTVDADVAAGELVNTATWAGLSDYTVHVVEPGEPGLDKSSPNEKTETQSGIVLPDSTIDYTVTLTNTGGATVVSDLVDTLPKGVTPVDGSYSVEPDSVVDGVITWKNVSVAAGQTFTVTFQVTVDADVAAGDLVNTAAWAGKDDFTTHVVEPAEPGLDKSSPTEVGSEGRPSGNVVTGETVHYVVTVTNTGGAAYTADLVDTLPDGVSDPRNFSVDTEGYTATPTISGQTLTWPSVSLIGGQTVTYEFDVTVSAQPDPGAIEDLVNNVTWGELTDSTRHIVAGPGVEIVPTLDKTADPETGSVVKIGDVITYTVKVGNNGNVALTGDLVDTLPGGIEVVGNYTRDDGGKAEPDTATATTLTWNAVTVQPGQVVTFTYDVKVLDSAQDLDSLVNTAEWFGLKASTEHTVTVPQLPQTGLGMNPVTTLGWAAGLLLLGVAFLLMGRRRQEGEQD